MDIQSGNDAVDLKLTALYRAIEDKDVKQTHALLEDMHEMCLTSKELAKWLINPANITNMHEKLESDLGVPRKTMQLRVRIPNFHRRAVYFIKAMINGVSRVMPKDE
jgi:hypothetical protein